MTHDYHHILQVAAGVIGFCAYIPLVTGILKNDVKQSFAAFLLWGFLDSIATITTIMEGGNFFLPLSNVVGATTITILLVVKKQVAWTRIETMTALLVIVCLVVWYFAGETAGIVASSIAVVIASVPQMVDTFKDPSATPLFPYFIFLTANLLSFFAGREWTVEERFYAACSIFLCAAIIVLRFVGKKKG